MKKKLKKAFRPIISAYKNKANWGNKRYREYLKNGKQTVFAFKINGWKQEHICNAFDQYNWVFADKKDHPSVFRKLIRRTKDPIMLVWGYNDAPSVSKFARKRKIPLWRMEDGFVRSIGLGANHSAPLSLVIDKSSTLYFDPRNPSDLEDIILENTFSPEQLSQAASFIDTIKKTGISKYNTQSCLEGKKYYDSFGQALNQRKRILVVGQVEDDASIRMGGCGYDNGKLVWHVRNKYPDAQIFFKVHPDVLAGKREIKTPLSEIENIAHVITEPMSIAKSFESIDEVYTISSLAGFEALIHKKKVFVAGQPFYAGYGLTEDLNPIERRRKNCCRLNHLTDEEKLLHIFYAAYIEYPSYFNPFSGENLDLQGALKLLELGRELREQRKKFEHAKQDLA